MKMRKIKALKQFFLENENINGFLVFDYANLIWLTGFSGASAMFLPKKGDVVVYVYGVNYSRAESELTGVKVELVNRGENFMTKIAKHASAFETKKLAVDTLSVESWRALSKYLGGEKMLELDNSYIRELRKVKDAEELELMKKAGDLTSKGMQTAQEVVAAGVKEYEVAAEMEYSMRKGGASGIAFNTIVASGPNSVFPHGGCSDREIRNGELVVVDVGATYKFYHSDMSRTFVAGRASEKQKKLYQIVKSAQQIALESIKPGVEAKDVDAAARNKITESGFGEFFVHSLGHGVGLEVHEPPTLGPDSKENLAIGNVVTVEPGIYIVGYGGIRIEDTVVLRKNAVEKLTNGPYIIGKE
jgi:Xaa-Pro aminopeptidase